MTTLEFYTNIIIVVLLLIAIFYAARLSRQLSRNAKQQKQMSELAQALIYAVNKLDTQSTPSHIPNKNTTGERQEFFPTVEAQKPSKVEHVSEAERELLMALRSIK